MIETTSEGTSGGKPIGTIPGTFAGYVLGLERLAPPSGRRICRSIIDRTALPERDRRPAEQQGPALSPRRPARRAQRLAQARSTAAAHKGAIEAHLSRRAGELFAVDNEVLLYEVTSTYFEGEANPLAQRGYSRDHRGDRKRC
jgi:hypothetical protein